MAKLDVLSRIEVAFQAGKKRAGWLAIPWGASIPVATCWHAHAETTPGHVALAAGGLLYSGLTVYSWMRDTLLVECETPWERRGAMAKAFGFVVLCEGTLVYPPTVWLGYGMLGLLSVFNAIAMQASMVLGRNRTAERAQQQEQAQQQEREQQQQRREQQQQRREQRLLQAQQLQLVQSKAKPKAKAPKAKPKAKAPKAKPKAKAPPEAKTKANSGTFSRRKAAA